MHFAFHLSLEQAFMFFFFSAFLTRQLTDSTCVLSKRVRWRQNAKRMFFFHLHLLNTDKIEQASLCCGIEGLY